MSSTTHPVVSATAADPGTVRSRRSRRRLRHRLTVLSFMAPALLGIAVFFVYPLVSALYFSFTKFNLLSAPEWVGLDNYRFMLEDRNLRMAAQNTLPWSRRSWCPPGSSRHWAPACCSATSSGAPASTAPLFYLPALVPPVAGTIAFVYLFKPDTGPVNVALEHLGINGPTVFNSTAWSKPSLVLLGLWACGDLMIIFPAALLDVPVEQHEAAQLDGANSWQRFRSITLPTISPVILFAAITGVISTLQYFTQAAVAASVASNQATLGGGISSTFGYPEGVDLHLSPVAVRGRSASATTVDGLRQRPGSSLLFVVAFRRHRCCSCACSRSFLVEGDMSSKTPSGNGSPGTSIAIALCVHVLAPVAFLGPDLVDVRPTGADRWTTGLTVSAPRQLQSWSSGHAAGPLICLRTPCFVRRSWPPSSCCCRQHSGGLRPRGSGRAGAGVPPSLW